MTAKDVYYHVHTSIRLSYSYYIFFLAFTTFSATSTACLSLFHEGADAPETPEIYRGNRGFPVVRVFQRLQRIFAKKIRSRQTPEGNWVFRSN